MGEYGWEVHEQAQELYVIEGLTYEKVAGITGVSVSQLKRWGKDEDWSGAKKEYRDELASIKRNGVKLRAKLLSKAVEDLDPQLVYAYAAAEGAAGPKGNQKEKAKPAPMPIAEREFESIAEMISALNEALQHKANVMVSTPGQLTSEGIKDLNEGLKLLKQMEADYAEKEAPGTATAEESEKVREELVKTVDELLGVR